DSRKLHQAFQDIEEPRQLEDGLRETGHRKAAVISDQPAAGRRKLRSPKPADFDAGSERVQLARQRACVQIARCLAARQQQANAQEGRLNSEAAIGALTRMSTTCRSRTGWPAWRTDAVKATCTPSTAL